MKIIEDSLDNNAENFHKWFILIGVTVIGMIGPISRYSMSVFFPYISLEFHWSHSLIGSAQALALWVYGLLVPFTGNMVDRLGSRRVFILGGFVTLIGWILFSTLNSVWELYLYYGFVMAISVSLTHTVPIQATIRKWFTKKSGLASGIGATAFAIGNAC